MVVTTRAALATIAIVVTSSCEAPAVPDHVPEVRAYVLAVKDPLGLDIFSEVAGPPDDADGGITIEVWRDWVATVDDVGIDSFGITRYRAYEDDPGDEITTGPWSSDHKIQLTSTTRLIVQRDGDRMTLTPEPEQEYTSWFPRTLERAEQSWRERRKPHAVWLLDIPVEELP